MKVLIAEDEKLAAERLMKMLSERDDDIEIVAVVDTVEAAVNYLTENKSPDLMFLDIQLGDGKSFEIFKQVSVSSHIIFTTAFDQYAIQAFKYNSIDYLLKPLKTKELDFAVSKFKEHNKPSETININELITQLKKPSAEYKQRFLVKKGTRLLSVEANNVAFAFTKDRIHYIKTFEGEEFFTDGNLDELETQLDPDQFFRANRQFILNYKAIDKVYSWFDGKLKVMCAPVAYEDIIISRLKANAFKKWMGK